MNESHSIIANVLSFIRGDLEEMSRATKGSFPAILTCFSGMDFLGALLFNLPKKNVTSLRIQRFLQGPMTKIDKDYTDIAEDLYLMLRVPLSHCGTLAGFFLVDSDESFRAKHLRRVTRDDRSYVALHTATFVEHYLDAADDSLASLQDRSDDYLSGILKALLPDLYREPPRSIPMAEPPYSPPETPPDNWQAPPLMPNMMNGTCVKDTPGRL